MGADRRGERAARRRRAVEALHGTKLTTITKPTGELFVLLVAVVFLVSSRTSRMSRRVLLTTAALVAAVALYVLFVLPPAPRQVALSAPEDPSVLKGAIHIHTVRSDGGGTLDEVASAAAHAGLHFIIVTDHGDGRRAEPPSYRHGVLVIDGAEISTDDGHVVAAGFRAPEYRLAGEGRDVIADVHRLGGIAVLAHPTSPKPALAWHAWETPFDGMEWLNGDSEWRDESVPSLLRLVLGYPWRPAAAVAAAFDRPVDALARYDALAATRRVAALAGHDAHARVGLDGDMVEEGDQGEDSLASWRRRGLPLPRYRTAFESFAIRVLASAPLGRDAEADAALVLNAFRQGRLYTAIDGIASPARVSFTARSGFATALMGDSLDPGGPLRFEIVADAPARSRIVLLRDGEEVLAGAPPALRGELPTVTGAYRVEVHVNGAPGAPPVPWVLTNPIYVGLPPRELPPLQGLGSSVESLSDSTAASAWLVERQEGSEGTVALDAEGTLVFDYHVGEQPAQSPYAALVRPVRLDPGATAVTLRIRTDRPMRLSLQLRAPGSGEGDRWRRSFYADMHERSLRVDFSEMRPVEEGQPRQVPLGAIDTLLLVVDTVNSDPGARGRIWLTGIDVVK